MKQVIVEMADADMRTLKKVARQRARDPAALLQEQMMSIVASKKLGPTVFLKSFKRTRRSKVRTVLPMRSEGAASAVVVQTPLAIAATSANKDEMDARERRLQVLRRTSGLMKTDPLFPKDGLEYQSSVRAEWD